MKPIPTKQQILDWIAQNPTRTSKRDIARAFGVSGAARIDLKRLLRELEAEGHLEKRDKSYRDPNRLAPVSVLEVLGPDAGGDLVARPLDWRGEAAAPRVLVVPTAKSPAKAPALGEGDRILARLTPIKGGVKGGDFAYEARVIRRIDRAPLTVLGVFRTTAEGGRIVPVRKGSDKEWRVAPGATMGAKDGELVEAERAGPKARMGLPLARISARLGDPAAPRSVSLIAIHEYAIPDAFPQDVLDDAAAMKPAPLGKREDLRAVKLVTIDPSDARDHDDACFAQPDDDPKNPGGHIVWVAIADVAFYVRPGTALDKEARTRGNSTYFPDRVVPMLPDRLSGDLCSLHEGVERPCIAVRMVLNAKGEKIAHRFTRAMMRSAASLNYQEVQEAIDGTPNAKTAPLLDDVIRPLFRAYSSAKQARNQRQPLDLDLPERRIILDSDGTVRSVSFRDRLDAHRLIEEFMILANVAAAEDLSQKRSPLLFRVHEEPSPEKLEALREVAQASGYVLAKGQVLKTRHLNQLLAQAEGGEFDELINLATLRSMTQAYYHPENFGHFGLALKAYAHFTSPIRRYADLIVHRALIAAHHWGKDGLSPGEIERLPETAVHISDTERRSMLAERDTTDRYLAAYLSEKVGTEFSGRISGVTRFGVFVKLDETGADGLVPVRSLGREYFRYDDDARTLTGEETGLRLAIGQPVTVRLTEAVPVTGGLMLELLTLDDKPLPRAKGGGSRKPQRRRAKSGKARQKRSRK